MSHGDPGRPRLFMPLPGRVDGGPFFHRHMADVLALADGELPPGPGPGELDVYQWQHAARAAVIAALRQAGPWPEGVFGALMRAIVHDPDPSFNRQLIEPALAAAGHRRVQEALLHLLDNGTNAEKAGAARAWYWAQIPLDGPQAKDWKERFAHDPETALNAFMEFRARWHEITRRELTFTEEVTARWREAALREFVVNEDLDVRRCLLPGLTLQPGRYPDSLKDLVTASVRIARAHPDEYIRHRVEQQV